MARRYRSWPTNYKWKKQVSESDYDESDDVPVVVSGSYSSVQKIRDPAPAPAPAVPSKIYILPNTYQLVPGETELIQEPEETVVEEETIQQQEPVQHAKSSSPFFFTLFILFIMLFLLIWLFMLYTKTTPRDLCKNCRAAGMAAKSKGRRKRRPQQIEYESEPPSDASGIVEQEEKTLFSRPAYLTEEPAAKEEKATAVSTSQYAPEVPTLETCSIRQQVQKKPIIQVHSAKGETIKLEITAGCEDDCDPCRKYTTTVNIDGCPASANDFTTDQESVVGCDYEDTSSVVSQLCPQDKRVIFQRYMGPNENVWVSENESN